MSQRSGLWIQNRFVAVLRKYFKANIVSNSQYLFSLLYEPLSFLLALLPCFVDYPFKVHVSGVLNIMLWLATILTEYYLIKYEDNRGRHWALRYIDCYTYYIECMLINCVPRVFIHYLRRGNFHCLELITFSSFLSAKDRKDARGCSTT